MDGPLYISANMYFKAQLLMLSMLAVGGAFAGCIPTVSEVSDGAEFIGHNNWAILDGVPVGDDSEDVHDLRREIPVALVSPYPELTIGPGYLARISSSNSYVKFMVEVTNISERPWCGINASPLLFYTASGLRIESTAFLNGSVGCLGYDIEMSTCLAPGETGYLLDIKEANYDDIVSIEITLDRLGIWPLEPTARALPLEYQHDATAQTLGVTFENNGNGNAMIAGKYSKWLLLDEDGTPLTWGFLIDQIMPADGVVLQDAWGEVRDEGIVYRGQGVYLRTWIDFEDESDESRSATQPIDVVTGTTAWEELYYRSLRDNALDASIDINTGVHGRL